MNVGKTLLKESQNVFLRYTRLQLKLLKLPMRTVEICRNLHQIWVKRCKLSLVGSKLWVRPFAIFIDELGCVFFSTGNKERNELQFYEGKPFKKSSPKS